jgi:hypothetical protein
MEYYLNYIYNLCYDGNFAASPFWLSSYAPAIFHLLNNGSYIFRCSEWKRSRISSYRDYNNNFRRVHSVSNFETIKKGNTLFHSEENSSSFNALNYHLISDGVWDLRTRKHFGHQIEVFNDWKVPHKIW